MLTETQQEYANSLLNKENTVYFKFHAGPSQTDYVSIEVASLKRGADYEIIPGYAGVRAVCQDMTYFLAKNFGLGLGRRNTAREFQIPQGGSGYNKAFNVAYTLAHMLEIDPANLPRNWRY